MRLLLISLFVSMSVTLASDCCLGDMIFSEVMYNPSGTDGFSTLRRNSEWIEVFNNGPDDVSLIGWSLSKSSVNLGTFAAGIGDLLLSPGEFGVLVPGDADATPLDYQTAWGIDPGVDIIRVTGWGPGSPDGLNNAGAVLALFNASSVLVDDLNYGAAGFPLVGGIGGPSVRLKDLGSPFYDSLTNNVGANWEFGGSVIPVPGTYHGVVFGNADKADPGAGSYSFASVVVPEPSSIFLFLAGVPGLIATAVRARQSRRRATNGPTLPMLLATC